MRRRSGVSRSEEECVLQLFHAINRHLEATLRVKAGHCHRQECVVLKLNEEVYDEAPRVVRASPDVGKRKEGV